MQFIMNMIRSTMFVSIFSSTSLVAHSANWTADELRAAEHSFGISGKSNRSLRLLSINPTTGHKEIGIARTISEEIEFQLRPNFNNSTEQKFHMELCTQDAFVLAEAVESISRLTTDESMILTKTDFIVKDIFSNKTKLSVGQPVSIARSGGEVTTDQGKIRVTHQQEKPFQSGTLYLLMLRKIMDRNENSWPSLFRTQAENIAIHQDTALINGGSWTFITHGDSYADIKGKITRISADKNCKY